MWLGWSGIRVAGSSLQHVILHNCITGQNYLDFLQNELPKQLEDVPLATQIAMYFQHDGAPSHYTQHVMQHPND